MAIASVSWASWLIEPYDIAPVQVTPADGPLGEGARVSAARLLGNHVQADARHPGRGPGEVVIHEVPVQADRLEDLRAAVALQRRDPHLGHDLQDPLV